MKILFLVPYPTEGASNRYRVEQYLPYLKRAGIKYALHPFWSNSAFKVLYKPGQHVKKLYYFILGTISRICDLFLIFRYDAVFIHRETYPIGGAFFETILALLKKPFIFDFDDAIFLPTSSHSNYFAEKYKKPKRVAHIIKMSKHIIAGNSYLADYALRYNNSVSVIPTPIDTSKYHPNKKINTGEVVIGWIGSVTTLNFLYEMSDVIIQLSKHFPNIKFKIVGGHFKVNCLTNLISKSWSLKREIEDLKTFDIGIMPMSDNEWTRGKCGFKAILYLSMGIPCVCSPVGVNKEIVIDGVNGFFAQTKEDWIEKLSILIENFNLRKKIGNEGRKTVEEKYSLQVNAPRFLEVLQKARKRQEQTMG